MEYLKMCSAVYSPEVCSDAGRLLGDQALTSSKVACDALTSAATRASAGASVKPAFLLQRSDMLDATLVAKGEEDSVAAAPQIDVQLKATSADTGSPSTKELAPWADAVLHNRGSIVFQDADNSPGKKRSTKPATKASPAAKAQPPQGGEVAKDSAMGQAEKKKKRVTLTTTSAPESSLAEGPEARQKAKEPEGRADIHPVVSPLIKEPEGRADIHPVVNPLIKVDTKANHRLLNKLRKKVKGMPGILEIGTQSNIQDIDDVIEDEEVFSPYNRSSNSTLTKPEPTSRPIFMDAEVGVHDGTSSTMTDSEFSGLATCTHAATGSLDADPQGVFCVPVGCHSQAPAIVVLQDQGPFGAGSDRAAWVYGNGLDDLLKQGYAVMVVENMLGSGCSARAVQALAFVRNVANTTCVNPKRIAIMGQTGRTSACAVQAALADVEVKAVVGIDADFLVHRAQLRIGKPGSAGTQGLPFLGVMRQRNKRLQKITNAISSGGLQATFAFYPKDVRLSDSFFVKYNKISTEVQFFLSRTLSDVLPAWAAGNATAAPAPARFKSLPATSAPARSRTTVTPAAPASSTTPPPSAPASSSTQPPSTPMSSTTWHPPTAPVSSTWHPPTTPVSSTTWHPPSAPVSSTKQPPASEGGRSADTAWSTSGFVKKGLVVEPRNGILKKLLSKATPASVGEPSATPAASALRAKEAVTTREQKTPATALAEAAASAAAQFKASAARFLQASTEWKQQTHHEADDEDFNDPRCTRNIEFGTQQLRAHMCVPHLQKADVRLPVVVLVHGLQASKERMLKNWDIFLSRGFVVMAVDYRPFACPEDVVEAVGWLRKNAEQYHVNVDHVGLHGYSLGGVCATTVALAGALQVQAVSSLSGAPSNATVHHSLGTPTSFFFAHATDDTVIDMGVAEAARRDLAEAGVSVTLLRLPSGGHTPLKAHSQEIITETLRFFSSVLKGEMLAQAKRTS